MRQLLIVLNEGPVVSFHNNHLYLKLPNEPGAVLRPEDFHKTYISQQHHGRWAICLREGYEARPPFPGENPEITNFLFKKYWYFGIPDQRDTLFFIPKGYVYTIDIESNPAILQAP